ncbi:Ig-like domain repeat protein, partial [Methanobrevibacter sp. UBA188]|uniref:Ig-like domain repeat protein n=1 Tax=Methanobrevibacter sp. UBA188 TaxID=1915473 RepID=UPI0025F8A7C1
LVYMYNTTGSKVEKDVYIYNGADLLGSYGGLTNPIRVDSVIDVNTANINNAVAYIFANGAVDGRGTVVINGESEAHPWNGSSQSTDLYTKDITSAVKNSNNISVIFSGASGSFTALQQIVVLTKKETPVKIATKITAPSVTKVYNVNKKFTATLKDANNKAISGVKVTITLNGKTYTKPTNVKGQAILDLPNLAPKTYKVSVKFAGDSKYKASSLNTAKVVVKKATPKMTGKTKVTYKVKTKTKKYTIVLKNNKKQAMKKVKVTLKVKGKTYKATTNAKGKAVFKITKLTKKGKYTAKVKFAGNKYYSALNKTVKITVKK